MPDVLRSADASEKVCINTVEGGDMTRDLAILFRPWLTTNQFLHELDVNLQKAMARQDPSRGRPGQTWTSPAVT